MKNNQEGGPAVAELTPPVPEAPASIDGATYRDALRCFASGVTIVTIRAVGDEGEHVHGLTVSAFASLSPSPPLVAVVIDQRHSAHAMLEQPEATFAVNLLAADQQPLSDRFAWVSDEDRFAQGEWTTASTGAPVLADALAWLDCCVHARCAAGTHTIYIGRVVAAQVEEAARAPLVYWNRDYRDLVGVGSDLSAKCST